MLIVMNLNEFSQHLYADYILKNVITSPISVSDNQEGQFLWLFVVDGARKDSIGLTTIKGRSLQKVW